MPGEMEGSIPDKPNTPRVQCIADSVLRMLSVVSMYFGVLGWRDRVAACLILFGFPPHLLINELSATHLLARSAAFCPLVAGKMPFFDGVFCPFGFPGRPCTLLGRPPRFKKFGTVQLLWAASPADVQQSGSDPSLGN